MTKKIQLYDKLRYTMLFSWEMMQKCVNRCQFQLQQRSYHETIYHFIDDD